MFNPQLLTEKGMLVLVAGPSGAGKDTILAHVRAHFLKSPHIVFVQRVITRRPTSHEQNTYLTPEEFNASKAAGAFALHWHAHGLEYAIPREIEKHFAEGKVVIASVSRSVIKEARRKYSKVLYIGVTADQTVLAQRLANRSRETVEDIERRLSREIPSIDHDETNIEIDNTGNLSEAVSRFIAIVESLVQVTELNNGNLE